MNSINSIFSMLWEKYTTQNPSVQKVYDSFTNLGEEVLNDHIAFRTFNDSRINIKVLEKLFVENGYVAMNHYNFEEKKLDAVHYEHPELSDLPRVFISELKIELFSEQFQLAIKNILNSISDSVYQNKNLIFSGSVWDKPSYKIYEALRTESEYAAWLYVFGFCANHFTVSINNLKQFSTIEKVNQHLKNNGFRLNESGGEIKGTKEDLLQQSSIIAEKVEIDFKEGTYKIPGCYYEFAIRYKDINGELYNGFIANNANRIFESTNFYKS